MTDEELQRRHLRRRIRATFRVRDANDPRQGEILFDSIDLSLGGAFLHSELLLEVGEELEVVFGLPGLIRPIRARARVVRSIRDVNGQGVSGMGLEFTNLTNDDRNAIATFIQTAGGQ